MARLESSCRQNTETIDYHYQKRRFFARLLNSLVTIPHLKKPLYLSDRLFRRSATFSAYLNETFKLGLPLAIRTKTGDGLLTFICRSYYLSDTYEVVETLLENGIDPNQINESGFNALQCLMINNRLPAIGRAPEIILLLVRYKVDINHVDYYGHNAIWRLSESQDIEEFLKYSRILLECGIDHSNALFHFLHAHKHVRLARIPDLIELFFFYGFDLNEVSGRPRENLLLLLAQKCNYCDPAFISIVELLIRYGIDINHTDARGRNILNLILSEEKIIKFKAYCKIIKFLVENGINVNNADVNLNNALIAFVHKAKKYLKRSLDVASLLVENGININHAYRCKLNVLWVVMQRKEIALEQVVNMCRHLIELGASVNTGRDSGLPFGDSLLLLVVSFRLSRYDDIDDEESDDVGAPSYDDGASTAHYDDKHWHSVIELLLEHGDNPNAFHQDGRLITNPLLVLCRNYKGNNLGELIKLMRLYGLDVNDAMKRIGRQSSSPLYWIKRNEKQKGRYGELLKVLVDCGLKSVDWAQDGNRERMLSAIGKNSAQYVLNRSIGLK